MKKFPACMLLDYIGFGLATMMILLLSKPFNIENALLRDGILLQYGQLWYILLRLSVARPR